MTTKICVLGDGAMGTACALLLARRPDHEVVLWSARPENAKLLRERRENVRYLPGVPIPPSIQLTDDLSLALHGARLGIMAIPTVYLRDTITPHRSHFGDNNLSLVSVAKVLERGTFLRPTEILLQTLGPRPVCVLSGPSHAEEISRGLPAIVVAASENNELAHQVQERFCHRSFRVYTNTDLVGVELAGALKNVIGIAAGISDGLGFGDNTKSALLTRALVEMVRFGTAHRGQPETFFGLAGMGDLITTCISNHGRNLRVGRLIGQGQSLAEILAGTTMVAEGVYTTRSVFDRATQLRIDMPICVEVYRVLYEGKSPRQAVQDLMTRDLKSE